MLGGLGRERGARDKFYNKEDWERHIKKGLGGTRVRGRGEGIRESISGVRQIEDGLSKMRVREGWLIRARERGVNVRSRGGIKVMRE